MVSLKQILAALVSLNVDKGHIDNAIAELSALLAELDEVEVKGRQNLDTLLGCILAIEAIVGKEAADG